MRTSAPVGLGLQQALLRARHAHGIAEGGEDHARRLGERDAVVDASHRQHADRAAGPVHQLDGVRQHRLDAVAEDRMGVAAADLHDLERTASHAVAMRATRPSISRSRTCALPRIAEFVDVFHAAALPSRSHDRRDRRPAGCARDPTGCDRRRRDTPGCGGCCRSRRPGSDRTHHSTAILPPSPPASPMVTRPISLALAKAAIRFAELPLVEMPIRPSPALRLGDDLTHEDVLEADIVADRGDHCRIGDKVDRGERRTAGGDRVQEFHGDVCGIAARAAVAHRKQPAAAAVDVGKGCRRVRRRPALPKKRISITA